MKSLDERGVYQVRPGRIIKGAKGEVPNAVTVGLNTLAQPLDDYNRFFRRQQLLRQVQPLADMVASRSNSTSAAAAPNSESHTSEESGLSISSSSGILTHSILQTTQVQTQTASVLMMSLMPPLKASRTQT